MGSSGSESSTPDKMATAASIFTEQSNLVSKCKRFEQKYRMALEQKVDRLCVCVVLLYLKQTQRFRPSLATSGAPPPRLIHLLW